MNLGPCRVTNPADNPTFFEESWNSNANIFFVDQPIGVGFSYAEHSQSVVCDSLTCSLLLLLMTWFIGYLRGCS